MEKKINLVKRIRDKGIAHTGFEDKRGFECILDEEKDVAIRAAEKLEKDVPFRPYSHVAVRKASLKNETVYNLPAVRGTHSVYCDYLISELKRKYGKDSAMSKFMRYFT